VGDKESARLDRENAAFPTNKNQMKGSQLSRRVKSLIARKI